MTDTSWLTIKVELLSGRALTLKHPPGRLMLAAPQHSLAELAEAIDLAFARWDHSHLHEFEFTDGGRYMPGGSDFEPGVMDSEDVTLRSLGLAGGASFEYVFDLGDNWKHRCLVHSTDADPEEEYGSPPDQPVPIWGWGTIPDQYGRITEAEDDED